MVVLDFTFLEAVFDDNHNSPFKVSYHVRKNVILKIKGSAASAVFLLMIKNSLCIAYMYLGTVIYNVIKFHKLIDY